MKRKRIWKDKLGVKLSIITIKRNNNKNTMVVKEGKKEKANIKKENGI